MKKVLLITFLSLIFCFTKSQVVLESDTVYQIENCSFYFSIKASNIGASQSDLYITNQTNDKTQWVSIAPNSSIEYSGGISADSGLNRIVFYSESDTLSSRNVQCWCYPTPPIQVGVRSDGIMIVTTSRQTNSLQVCDASGKSIPMINFGFQYYSSIPLSSGIYFVKDLNYGFFTRVFAP